MSMIPEDILVKQIATAEKAEGFNQGVPKPWPGRDQYEEKVRWQMKCLQFDNSVSNNQRSTMLSSNIHSCKTPFENLKPTKLREMKLPMVHKGQYLVCQVIDRPLPLVGVSTLIQDLNGDVEEVIIYNFCYNINQVEWLKKGTIMIIKEPWLRYGMSGTGFSLRIDSPSDIIFVDLSDDEFLNKIGAGKWYKQMSKDSEVICKEARECFKNGDCDSAMKLYDRGIRYNPKLPVLYLNKSLTCLRTGAFNMAYATAKFGLDNGGDREKALYRMGMAAYGMREWHKSANHFVEVLKEFPENNAAKEQLKRANARMTEQQNGKFNFKSMEMEKDVDVSDYTGPIEIAEIPGKGRGIIASKDIPKGTLLVVSKAFSSSYSKDFPGNLLSLNLIRKTEGTAAEMLQAVKAMENVQKNPQRAKEIYDLYAGDVMKENNAIPDGVVDAARIQKICALNCFSSDDSVRIRNENCHLFVLPSYFNHSCIANAHRDIYGDVMVVHASTNIKKGDEICLAYTHPLIPKRKERLQCWNFTCQCCLCKVEAEDANCLKRNQIFNEFHKNVKSQNVSKLESLVKQMRETYSMGNNYKLHLAQMLEVLAGVYFDLDNMKKSMSYLEEVVSLMDDPLEYVMNITNVRVNLALNYLSLKHTSKAKEMVQKAFELSPCIDIEHFKMRYPEVAKWFKEI